MLTIASLWWLWLLGTAVFGLRWHKYRILRFARMLDDLSVNPLSNSPAARRTDDDGIDAREAREAIMELATMALTCVSAILLVLALFTHALRAIGIGG